MNPGSLNKRATFKENIPIGDGAGGYDDNWTECFTCWVKIKTLAPEHREFMGNQATFFPAWFIMRKSISTIPKADMKVFVGVTEYNVLSVRNYEPDPKYWEVELKELAP